MLKRTTKILAALLVVFSCGNAMAAFSVEVIVTDLSPLGTDGGAANMRDMTGFSAYEVILHSDSDRFSGFNARFETGTTDHPGSFVNRFSGTVQTGETFRQTCCDGPAAAFLGFTPNSDTHFNVPVETWLAVGAMETSNVLSGAFAPVGAGNDVLSRSIANLVMPTGSKALFTVIPTAPGGVELDQQTFTIEAGPTGGEPGDDETNPIMPEGSDPATGAWVFNDVDGTGNWFDPIMAHRYDYAITDGLSNFTHVGLPSLATVPDGDGMYTIVSSEGVVNVAAGAIHAFGPGINFFSVLGINPNVDGDDPLAFPTFLQFDQLVVSFTQTPVPLPAAGWAGLALLGAMGLRRRVKG